jgi:hypothetical protein
VVIWIIFVFLFCRGNSRLTASNGRPYTGSRRLSRDVEKFLFLVRNLVRHIYALNSNLSFP